MVHHTSARVARRDAAAKEFGNLPVTEKLHDLRALRVCYPILQDRITRMIPFVFQNRNPILPFLTRSSSS